MTPKLSAEELADHVIERLENGIGVGHTEAFVLGCKHCLEIVRRIRDEQRHPSPQAEE